MKNSKIIIICLIIAITFCILGFILGKITPQKKSFIGTYYCSTWNGKSATLVINEDGTCKYPTGDDGKWDTDGKIINLYLQNSSIISSETAVIEKKEGEYNNKHVATIVKDGLILHNQFFKKMN